MKKMFIWLVVIVMFAACAPSESAVTPEIIRETVVAEIPVTVEVTRETVVERIVEVTQEVEVTRIVEIKVTATGTPMPNPLSDSTDPIALNYVAEVENGGLTIQIARVLVGTVETIKIEGGSAFDFLDEFEADVVGEFIFIVTNNSDKTVEIYPQWGTVQVNSEQIELSDDGSGFGDEINGEIFPGVTKIGGFWFGIKRSEVPEIVEMTLRFNSPRDADDFRELGDDFEIVIDLSTRIFEPLPDEL